MRWQDVAKILTGGGVGVFTLFAALFLLTGVTYTHTGDITCDNACDAYINVTTTYWRICFDSYGGTKYENETLFKKQTRSRTLHVNLDHIDSVIDTDPMVEVDWYVPARGAGNWRHLKGGDCWDRGKTNRIKLNTTKEYWQEIKWSFILGDHIDIDPLWKPVKDTNVVLDKNYDCLDVKSNVTRYEYDYCNDTIYNATTDSMQDTTYICNERFVTTESSKQVCTELELFNVTLVKKNEKLKEYVCNSTMWGKCEYDYDTYQIKCRSKIDGDSYVYIDEKFKFTIDTFYELTNPKYQVQCVKK